MNQNDFAGWHERGIEVTDIVNRDDDALLEVDLEYPRDLHDQHSSLPLYFESCRQEKDVKLMATVRDKERYVIHYRMLKKALELGLKTKKIHRVLKFKQARWIELYIMRNTEYKNAAAKSDFEQDFFKLINNAVFGKSMENVRKMRYFRLVNK